MRPHNYIEGNPIYLPTDLVYTPTHNIAYLARYAVVGPDPGAFIGHYTNQKSYQSAGKAQPGTIYELPTEPFATLIQYAAPVANVQSGDSGC